MQPKMKVVQAGAALALTVVSMVGGAEAWGETVRKTFAPSNLDMVWIPAGTFEMGCVVGDPDCLGDERPPHTVTLTRGFWIGIAEVTAGQYRLFAGATGHPLPPQPAWSRDNHPVVNVSWDDAAGFCSWAGGRLPSEAEWEYAARGGSDGKRFPAGDELTHDDANFAGSGGRDRFPDSAPVASFAPNGFGLYDVVGNVWEWCADWYGEATYGGPATDPTGPASGTLRVLRGGSYNYQTRSLRLSDRGRSRPDRRAEFIGFRCVRDGEPSEPVAPAGKPLEATGPEQPPRKIGAGAPPAPDRTSGAAPESAAKEQTAIEAAPAVEVGPTPTPARPAAPVGPPPGETSSFPPAEATMAWIPPATVDIGCVKGDGECDGDEQPRHSVTFSRGFWVDVTEVTVGQYRAFASAAGHAMPRQPEWSGDDHPVVNVSWYDAAAYCAWAGGRLPSEAEWEYAARGGLEGAKFASGAHLDEDAANADGVAGADRWEKSAPVRSFPPNGFGLYDMAGNVWEWCADWYAPRTYAEEAVSDPQGPPDGSQRVVRGGSWTSNQWRMRLSYRFRLAPSDTSVTLGFRCVR
jgi:formylglycine-generating enzyme required for sulfatase activity